MNTIKGAPAYWKKFLDKVLARVKQLSLPIFFLTLPYANFSWRFEPILIISKPKDNVLSEDEIHDLSYHDRHKLLNKKTVLVARYFQFSWTSRQNKILCHQS